MAGPLIDDGIKQRPGGLFAGQLRLADAFKCSDGGLLQRRQQLTRKQRHAGRAALRRHLLLSKCVHCASCLVLVGSSLKSEYMHSHMAKIKKQANSDNYLHQMQIKPSRGRFLRRVQTLRP